MTDEELERAAVAAIRSAAERLGVDPFRLARFLAHGRIAEYLQTLGRTAAFELDRRDTNELSRSYVDFLDEEMRKREGGPGGRANGG